MRGRTLCPGTADTLSGVGSDSGRTLLQKARTLSANSLILGADTHGSDTFISECPGRTVLQPVSSFRSKRLGGRTDCPDSSKRWVGGHSLPSLEGSVPPPAKGKKTIPSVAERFNRMNLQSALIIIADVQQFPEGSGGRLWAEAFMRRLQRDRERNAGRLFE